MKLYFAPMEGFTDAVFRRVHRRMFPGVEKYFMPFISPSASLSFTKREMYDLSPEANAGVPAVPQILAKDPDHFLGAARMLRDIGYTEINLTDRYARTASARVRVVGRDGIPVKGARVEFCIYNASEFFPAITKFTDAAGETTLTAGIGDLLVWASKDGAYGYRKLSVGQEGEVVVKLTSPVGAPLKTERMTICPPVETYVEPELPQEVHDRCNARIAQDDSIRTAYTSTFPSRASASAFTERYDLPDFFTGVLEHAAGNAATVVGFLL